MSILNIAYSGLNAFQYALDVAGNNIANATTKGYSRQSILLTQAAPHRYGRAMMGSGAMVSSVYRNADQFANAQVRGTLSTKSQYETFYEQANRIDQMLSQGGSSVSSAMQGFFESLNQLNNAPDSAASRGIVLSQSQLLTGQFAFLQKNLDEYQQNNTAQLSAMTNRINDICSELVAFNAQVTGTPNMPQLLDHRDELLSELSEYSELTIAELENGTVNVGLSTGEMLVVGTDQRKMSVKFDPLHSQGSTVLLGSGAGQLDITAELKTGKLGGLMTYETNVIAATSQAIGLMAIGLAQTFNAQNALGMDLNSQLGQNIFTDYNSAQQQSQRSIATASNTGTASLSVAITDLSQVKLSDYTFVVTDVATNQIRAIRESDGSTIDLTWTNTTPPAGQVVVDGLTITIDDIGNLANNDTYTVMPTRGAARDFGLLTKDPSKLALAAPIRTSASMGNMGTGKIALGTVLNTSGVSDQYLIDFISPTQFNVIDMTTGTTVAGPMPFTPDTENVVQIPDAMTPSYSIVLSGVPNAGDQFTAEYNQGGIGDNTNGLLLTGIPKAQFFDNNNETLFDCYTDLLSNIGTQTSQAKNRYAAFDILHKQAVDFQQSKSGVNLDEEGANLLRFEQAYAAAGKLMEVSNQMMQVLFEMMR